MADSLQEKNGPERKKIRISAGLTIHAAGLFLKEPAATKFKG